MHPDGSHMTKRRPHLLYIAFWYPPSRASGVYRALATSKAFKDAGWEVTVLTCTIEYLSTVVGSIDLSLIDQVPPGVDVVRVSRVTDFDVRSMTRLSANLPLLWSKTRTQMVGVRQRLDDLRGGDPSAYSFSDGYLAWIDPVVNSGLRVNSAKPVDHVLATGNPFSAFEAARLLSGQIAGGFSVDYRDPWTIDVFTGRTDLANRGTREAEHQIVAEADLCFHVNEAIADAYRQLFPEHAKKQHVVFNGFDSSSLPPVRSRRTGAVRFGILGTMNDKWPMDPIFMAWNSVRDRLPSGSELVFGGHVGYFAKSTGQLVEALPESTSGFRYLGPVPKAAVARFYDELDVVLLPVPGGPMVTSGKVFEAYALGIPIVCVQAEGGGARALLSDHPLAICVSPEPDSVADALLQGARLAHDLDSKVSSGIRFEAREFERNASLRPMVESIARVVGSQGP